jgi:glycerophosphoryl diester phosphodiesterase
MIAATGHRGAAKLAPENTLKSIQLAMDLGVDQVEIDVHLSRDNQLVVIHDDTVDRTTNGTGFVRQLLCTELRTLDAGDGEKIPTLQEVIDLISGRVRLQIELKGLGTTEPVVALLSEYGKPDQFLLTSFRHAMVQHAKTLYPALETAVLLASLPVNLPRVIADATADGVSLHFRYLTAEVVQQVHQAGYKVRAWNPDTLEEMKLIIAMSPDAIGSDRPDLLLQLLRRHR